MAIFQNASGQYILPDGSVWARTDAIYAGSNNTGPLEGYTYWGSNGSEWFAGSNNAQYPESQAAFQAAQNSAFQAVWSQETC